MFKIIDVVHTTQTYMFKLRWFTQRRFVRLKLFMWYTAKTCMFAPILVVHTCQHKLVRVSLYWWFSQHGLVVETFSPFKSGGIKKKKK